MMASFPSAQHQQHQPQLRTQRYGVSDPISTALPNPSDLEESSKLIEFLRATGFFESEMEGEKRESILGRLNMAIKEFVREVAKRKGLPSELCRTTCGKIFTFGSYRLGVHSKGADIDTLCVAPQHVTREDFFAVLPEVLGHQVQDLVVTAVPDAYVPVLKLEMEGICLDLVFARIPGETSISDSFDLLSNKMLASLDEKCVLSVNGSRTTDEILRLVPSVETFHTALRAIKLWAQRRALYGNSYGYLNGVACAILTARICQLYPNASASVILSRFFIIYLQWNWPQPVYLKTIEENPALGMKVWNPRINPSDRHHRMPVITPAYPSMCSTHNVSESTMKLMRMEMGRASDICKKVSTGSLPYEELFTNSDFFVRHRNFFQIIAIAGSEAEYRAWSGYVESRIRHLTMYLEREAEIDMAPPYPEGFEASCSGQDISCVLEKHVYKKEYGVVEGSVAKEDGVDDSKAITIATAAAAVGDEEIGLTQYYSMAFYVGITVKLDAAGKMPRRLLLDRPVNDFKTYVCGWEKMQPANMFLVVRDIRRDALPDYVFANGPPRPPAVVKRTAASGAATIPPSSNASSANKKRSSEALLQ
jgi:poly(A) polymerase